jgi:hypothetical protein
MPAWISAKIVFKFGEFEHSVSTIYRAVHQNFWWSAGSGHETCLEYSTSEYLIAETYLTTQPPYNLFAYGE